MSPIDINFRFITTLEKDLSLTLPSNPVLARNFLAKYFSLFGATSIAAPIVFKRYADVLTPEFLTNYKNSMPYVYTTITVMSFLAYLLNANRLKAKKKRFLQNAHLYFPSKIANPCGRIEKDSGNRIRIVFDGSKINDLELKRDLYLLKGASITTCKNKNPPSRIILKNFEFTGEELFLPLAELSTTKRLVFIDCPNLEKGHIKNILKILPSICRVDFIGCSKISREFATSINRDVRYLERSNAKNRNKDLLFDAFMEDLSTTLLKPELSIRVSRKLETTTGREPSYANLIELKELLDTPIPATPTSLSERDTRITELFSSLRDELNPLDKEEAEKRSTERNLRSFISGFLSKPYIHRLDSRFTINLSNHFIGPLGVTALFELMSKINANLVKLDLSNTFISGAELKFAKGLPITTLVLENLEHFKDINLKYLKTLPELEYLYLSGTAIDNQNFFRHVSSIANLKILFINNCKLLINNS